MGYCWTLYFLSKKHFVKYYHSVVIKSINDRDIDSYTDRQTDSQTHIQTIRTDMTDRQRASKRNCCRSRIELGRDIPWTLFVYLKLTSPSRAHDRPFWGYLIWVCLFFWPPSANLQSNGSAGAVDTFTERERREMSSVDVNYLPCCLPLVYFSRQLSRLLGLGASGILLFLLLSIKLMKQNASFGKSARKYDK